MCSAYGHLRFQPPPGRAHTLAIVGGLGGGLASGVSGGIIQTVQVIKTDTSSFTVPTQSFYDDTNFSASITPTSTSSKILVQMMISHGVSSSHSVSYELRCNGSTVAKGDQDGSGEGGWENGKDGSGERDLLKFDEFIQQIA